MIQASLFARAIAKDLLSGSLATRSDELVEKALAESERIGASIVEVGGHDIAESLGLELLLSIRNLRDKQHEAVLGPFRLIARAILRAVLIVASLALVGYLGLSFGLSGSSLILWVSALMLLLLLLMNFPGHLGAGGDDMDTVSRLNVREYRWQLAGMRARAQRRNERLIREIESPDPRLDSG